MNDLNSHPRADEALDWIQGLGTPEERAAFEEAMDADVTLGALVEALSDGAAVLAMSIPPAEPPAELKGRLLATIEDLPTDRETSSAPANVTPISPKPRTVSRIREALAWAAAIVFAIGCGWLWKKNGQSSNQLIAARGEVESLASELQLVRESRDFARLEVEALKATIEDYQEGVALVVWDEENQEGVLKLERMPPIPVDKDYQLWVVDPEKAAPVDAGVVRVDDQGFARVRFKPTATIAKADKFAISVERRGGVPQNEGPIVLLSP